MTMMFLRIDAIARALGGLAAVKGKLDKKSWKDAKLREELNRNAIT